MSVECHGSAISKNGNQVNNVRVSHTVMDVLEERHGRAMSKNSNRVSNMQMFYVVKDVWRLTCW